MQAIDVMYAYKQVQLVITKLKEIREKSAHVFKRIFTEACKLGQDLHGQEFELS